MRGITYRREALARMRAKAASRGLPEADANHFAKCSCFLCKSDKVTKVPTRQQRIADLRFYEGTYA